MIVKELRTYINTLPEAMDSYNVVNGEFGVADDDQTFVMTNNEVLTIYVDMKNKELQLLHQTDEDVKNILLDGDTDTE